MEIKKDSRKKLNSYCLISSTASSYFMPSSISARATRTGALPRPATQWTATQLSGHSLNLDFSSSNHSSIT
jgi:hypothetical protein